MHFIHTRLQHGSRAETPFINLHLLRHDHNRHVEAHHYCTHLSDDFHQCVIYDSDGPNAKLIGIEYIVSEKVAYCVPMTDSRSHHLVDIQVTAQGREEVLAFT